MVLEFILTIATMAVAIIAFVTLLIVFRQTQADFILKLNNDLFFKESNSKIIRKMEKGGKILIKNGGKFEESDLDDYLGTIELVDLFIKKRMVGKKDVDDMFGYYIVETFKNIEIRKYIMKTRKNLKDDNYYSGVEKLAREFS